MYNNSKVAKAIRLALVFGAATAMVPASHAFAEEIETKIQTEEEKQQLEKDVETITVTGSRIRRSEVEQNTPVFSFDSESLKIQGITNVADALNESPLFSGSQSPTGDQNAFNAGQNQVNLFDLGTQRTLTLVNGKRFVSSQSATGGGSQVDLNAIPAAMIERIETVPLTGAATYGADAIAGTVNVILKENYEGFELTGQYGNNAAGNQKTTQFSLVSGANFSDGRGNLTFGMEYTKDEGLLDCAQDFLCIDNWGLDSTQNGFIDRNGDGQPDDLNGDGKIDDEDSQSFRLGYQEQNLALFTQYGAISQPGDRFLPPYGSGAFPDGEHYEFAKNGNLQTCEPGATQSRSIITLGGEGICGIDFFDQVGQIRSPVERFNVYSAFNYDISDDIYFRTDFTYANTQGEELVNQGGFQTGFFGGTSAAINIPLDNPFLSSSNLQAIRDSGYTGDSIDIHRFNNDLVNLGGNANETHLWRVSSSLMGEFEYADRSFYWDVSAVYGRSDILQQTSGIVDGRFLNAVDARTIDENMLDQIRLSDPDNIADNDAALEVLRGANGGDTANFNRGDTICGAFADLAAGTLTGFNSRASGNGLVDEDIPFLDGCVPLNLFGSQASPEALAFINGGPQYAASDNTQRILSANIGGTVLELPAGDLGFVVGIETREEISNYNPGMGSRVPITRSTIDTPVSGGFETQEYYGEFVAPLISSDMDIPLVQAFEISGAYRYQEFKTNAPAGFDDRTTDADVYQASLKWQVYDDLAVRATASSAFRNPSIQELFQPSSQSFISGDDPCDARSVGLGPNPAVRKANCEAIGIDTSTFVSNIQDGTIPGGNVSGNSALEPETNESHSYGLIFTPSAIDGLSIAVDYYNLEINDYIDDVTFETNAATCFDSNNFPNETACSTFVRDADFQVIELTQGPANVALSTFESVTARIFYTYEFETMGSLSFDAFTMHNITNEFQATPASEVEEDVGDFGDPDYNGTVDTTWRYEDFTVSHRLRWQSSVKIDTLDQTLYATTHEVLEDGTVAGNFKNKTGSRFLNDISVRYNIADHTSVQLNVKNLLDRKPDSDSALAEAAGHFGLDERLGRRFSVNVTTRF
jgi:outer membrane receptor protein involved in Fe transport